MDKAVIFTVVTFVTATSAQWTPDPSCPYPSDHVTRYPYPGDCTKYWECYNGARYEQDCPQGLEFNYPLQQCDAPEIAKCDPDSTETLPPLPTEDPSKTTNNGFTPDPMCPYPSDELTFFPHEGDCGSYWQCYQGIKNLYNCPSGLWWNQEIKQCDYHSNVDCPWADVTTDNILSTTTKKTSDKTTSSPQKTTISYKCEEGGIVFHPHPNDCHKYIECVEGFPVEMECPANLLWNQAKLSCDYATNVDCENKSTPGKPDDTTTKRSVTTEPPSKTTASPLECQSDNDGFFPYPSDCHKYIRCEDGEATVVECAGDLVWDVDANMCDYSDNANCSV